MMKRPVFSIRLHSNMHDFLAHQSRTSGKSIVELINEGLEQMPMYLEYVAAIRKATLKNMLAETISTTVVEPATKVADGPPASEDEPEWDYSGEAERLAAFHKRDRENLMRHGMWTADDEAAYQRKYGKE